MIKRSQDTIPDVALLIIVVGRVRAVYFEKVNSSLIQGLPFLISDAYGESGIDWEFGRPASSSISLMFELRRISTSPRSFIARSVSWFC